MCHWKNRVDTVEALANSTNASVKIEANAYIEITKARTAAQNLDFDSSEVALNNAVKIISEASPYLKTSESFKDYNR